jgi:hypothetical protein
MYDRIQCTHGATDLEGLVPAGTDFDGTFLLICDLTGETLRVNGWMAEDITVMERGVSK